MGVKMVAKSEKFKLQACDEVIENMSQRGMSLRKACAAAGIARPTFLDWCKADKDLADRYARAREELIDHIATETLEIADQEPAKVIDDKGIVRIDSASVQKQRLQIDTRKWLLACLAPKKYGERIELSGDLDVPVRQSVIDVSKLPTEVLSQIMAAKDESN